MSEERIRLSFEDAVAMLPDGDEIHTFLNPGAGLMVGVDWHREEVVGLIRSHGAELSGPEATRMGHGLVVIRGSEPVFIATKRQL